LGESIPSKFLPGANQKYNKVQTYSKSSQQGGPSNQDKANMLLIAFLIKNQFNSYQQYIDMYNWIQKYSKPNEELFRNQISYEEGIFFERVIIVSDSSVDYEAGNVKLSDFMRLTHHQRGMIYAKCGSLKLFIDYLNHSDDYRKNFNRVVSGSSIYQGILRIKITQSSSEKLYSVHTCSNEIDIYNNDVSGLTIESLNAMLKGEEGSVQQHGGSKIKKIKKSSLNSKSKNKKYKSKSSLNSKSNSKSKK